MGCHGLLSILPVDEEASCAVWAPPIGVELFALLGLVLAAHVHLGPQLILTVRKRALVIKHGQTTDTATHTQGRCVWCGVGGPFVNRSCLVLVDAATVVQPVPTQLQRQTAENGKCLRPHSFSPCRLCHWLTHLGLILDLEVLLAAGDHTHTHTDNAHRDSSKHLPPSLPPSLSPLLTCRSFSQLSGLCRQSPTHAHKQPTSQPPSRPVLLPCPSRSPVPAT